MSGTQAPDLTKNPPRSPREYLGGFVMLARLIDKCRAEAAGTIGEYHYGCAMDEQFFDFMGIKPKDFEQAVVNAGDDGEVLDWLKRNATARTDEEIEAWSDRMFRMSPYNDPDKREWFVSECAKFGLDPQHSTLFDLLEADDGASFDRA